MGLGLEAWTWTLNVCRIICTLLLIGITRPIRQTQCHIHQDRHQSIGCLFISLVRATNNEKRKKIVFVFFLKGKTLLTDFREYRMGILNYNTIVLIFQLNL